MGKPIKISDRGKIWAKRSLERKIDIRPERERILIVCEGAKTEPNYFKSIQSTLPRHVVEICIYGEGANTQSLVNRAKEIHNSKKGTDYPYDETWVVFDKDSFGSDQFDNAIRSAESTGMKAAWSNEAFELWYILHFEARQTGMSRTEYKNCLTEYLETPYKKNDPDMYSRLVAKGDESKAIQRAKSLLSSHNGIPHHDANPCTKVNELVEKLNSFKVQ